MSEKSAQLLNALDNADNYADMLIAKLEQKAAEDIDNLINFAEQRDDELWESVGINSSLTADDYSDESADDRDINWALGLAGIFAMSATQFFLDNRADTIIKPAAYMMQSISGLGLTSAELKSAAIREIQFAELDKFYKLQNEVLKKFGRMQNLNNFELYAHLKDFGAIQSVEKQIVSMSSYVSRMTTLPPGSARFKEEVVRLINTNSTDVLRQMNRRAVEKISVVQQAGGDLKKKFIWVGEGGPAACDPCADRYGQIETLENWYMLGEPGASVCSGGDRCRCHLIEY